MQVREPQEAVQRILQFLDWGHARARANATVQKFLLSKTVEEVGGYANNAGLLKKRDITKIDTRWRDELTKHDELTIQARCGELALDSFWTQSRAAMLRLTNQAPSSSDI